MPEKISGYAASSGINTQSPANILFDTSSILAGTAEYESAKFRADNLPSFWAEKTNVTTSEQDGFGEQRVVKIEVSYWHLNAACDAMDAGDIVNIEHRFRRDAQYRIDRIETAMVSLGAPVASRFTVHPANLFVSQTNITYSGLVKTAETNYVSAFTIS